MKSESNRKRKKINKEEIWEKKFFFIYSDLFLKILNKIFFQNLFYIGWSKIPRMKYFSIQKIKKFFFSFLLIT